MAVTEPAHAIVHVCSDFPGWPSVDKAVNWALQSQQEFHKALHLGYLHLRSPGRLVAAGSSAHAASSQNFTWGSLLLSLLRRESAVHKLPLTSHHSLLPPARLYSAKRSDASPHTSSQELPQLRRCLFLRRGKEGGQDELLGDALTVRRGKVIGNRAAQIRTRTLTFPLPGSAGTESCAQRRQRGSSE